MVLEINPDAMQAAQELDEERKRGNIRGYVLTSILLINKQLTMVVDPCTVFPS